MRARYQGNHDSTTLFGIHFPRGVFVDIPVQFHEKVKGNSTFEVETMEAEIVEFKEVTTKRTYTKRK
jgi:hypothetical protein